jgi:hypothetical protein
MPYATLDPRVFDRSLVRSSTAAAVDISKATNFLVDLTASSWSDVPGMRSWSRWELLARDGGTRAIKRIDLRHPWWTLAESVSFEGHVAPLVKPSRMQRIRDVAPLSLRVWGDVFGVSHTTVLNWIEGEEPPDRPEVDRVLSIVERAAHRFRDVESWLKSPLGRLSTTPLSLLQRQRWRALEGALSIVKTTPPSVDTTELGRLRGDVLPWAIPELDHGIDE